MNIIYNSAKFGEFHVYYDEKYVYYSVLIFHSR